jgi:Transcription factor WhiB
MSRRGRIATDQLTRALLDLAAKGERTHCSDPTSHRLWTSEHETERAIAVMLCDHCPVLTVCRDTAEQRDERWGVWGGVDRSIRPGGQQMTAPGPVGRLVPSLASPYHRQPVSVAGDAAAPSHPLRAVMRWPDLIWRL